MFSLRKIRLLTGTSVAVLGLGACASNQSQMSSLDPQSRDIISEMGSDLKQRKMEAHHLISPDHFENASEHKDEAYELARDGASFAEVQAEIEKGQKQLQMVDKNVSQAEFHLKDVLAQRKEAMDEGADSLSSFEEADDELAELGEELEENDINEVLEERDEVKDLYVDAEVEAIQDRELMLARKNLEKAKNKDSIDAFEGMRDRTEKKIRTAERLIAQNKDNATRYKSAVEEATLTSDVLLARTKTGDWLKSTPVRELVRTIETDMGALGKDLEAGSLQRNSYQQKVALLRNEAAFVPVMRNQLSEAQVAALYSDHKLSVAKNEKRELASKVERQKALREKLQFVRDQFSDDEAEILLKGDDLIVRLVGLNFGVNKAKLPQGSEPMLDRVASAIKKFDSPEIEIQGHTDTTGEADYNRKLSQQRAQAVKNALSKRIDKTDLATAGYGFSRPIADNKSTSGRTKNRRIDVVIESVIN